MAALLVSTVGMWAQNASYVRLPREIIGERLHDYSRKNPEREARLKHLFEEAGCNGEHLQEQPVKHAPTPNVVCVLPGTGEGVIVVGAHYDKVAAGDGVVDNWSGASLLPSLYESLKAQPRKHTFIFISFADEEGGMVGSRFYARQLTKEEVARIEAMIDMDTLGLGPTKVWASHSSPGLVQALAGVAQAMNFPLAAVNVENVGNSDGQSFQDRKVPAITIHSVTQETWKILHSDQDTVAAVNWDDYYQSYQLIAAYLVWLDVSFPLKQAPK